MYRANPAQNTSHSPQTASVKAPPTHFDLAPHINTWSFSLVPAAPPFTPETARIAARISAQVRAQREIERKAKLERDIQAPAPTDEYVAAKLARTRAQLNQLDDMLEREKDPSKLDRIASAIEKLSRIEQNLAGRPGPGQLRPISKPSQSKSIPEPL